MVMVCQKRQNANDDLGLPLDGWGARMRDRKGPKMNLFNPKED
jgi:hypothetical protein